MFIAPLQFEGFVARLFFLNGQPSTVIIARKTKHQACNIRNTGDYTSNYSTGLEAAHKSPTPHDAYNSAGLEGAHNSAAPHDAHSSPALEAAHNSAGRHDTIRDHQQYALEGRRSVSSLMEFYEKSHMGKVETLNKVYL
ncbi:hypothetical protein RJT34_28175 [Clitoria ternatea]|uniref:Uncharacterized protein n=1 Tax=Clitoria ternatea TaxID=43366 RepID=A0AAN9FDD9_CLITE